MIKPQSMLLVLGLPFKREGDRLLCEAQAFNGLQRWIDNFASIVLAAPVMPSSTPKDWQNQGTWVDLATLQNSHQFEFIPLPWAYSLPEFVHHYSSTRSRLAEAIAECEYLQFALEWLIGDWAAIAALEALKQGRTYAIHKDIVSHKMLVQTANKSFKKRLIARLKAPIMKAYHYWIIRRAGLGLWHGADCYADYSPLCANSYLIHDIHTKQADLIDPETLTTKSSACQTETLKICYVGRLAAMKAPLQWVQALAALKQLDVPFLATWLGEGELRSATEAAIASAALTNRIQLLGFEPERDRVLQHLRSAHILVFTHITLESPRCLIEALISGTPIVGYESAYAKDLVKDHPAAGVFVPVGNWQQLAEVISEIERDRPLLAQRIHAAANCGQHFSDTAVFQHRSRLIKQHLSLPSLKPSDSPTNPQPDVDLDRRLKPDSLSAPTPAIARPKRPPQ
jgi:glycosyltransferase involved in cell wall biosynthesis